MINGSFTSTNFLLSAYFSYQWVVLITWLPFSDVESRNVVNTIKPDYRRRMFLIHVLIVKSSRNYKLNIRCANWPHPCIHVGKGRQPTTQFVCTWSHDWEDLLQMVTRTRWEHFCLLQINCIALHIVTQLGRTKKFLAYFSGIFLLKSMRG